MTMKNIYKTLLLAAGFFAFSCEQEVDPLSEVHTFEAYSPALATETPAVTANEKDGETFTFHFTLDDRQVSDVLLAISAGPGSTAKEGEDFDILTHEVEFPAFGGAEGFDVEVVVYPDYEAEEDETIFLTFSTENPSGVDKTEVQVITLQDANLPICEYDNASIVGPRTGIDITIDPDSFDSEVVISGEPGAFKITGLGRGWMTDFWGETILTMAEVDFNAVEQNDYITTFEIPSQTYMTTEYEGEEQDPYLIEGTALLDNCAKTLTIKYTLINNETDWGAWTHDGGYMTDETFTAVLDIP